jgi:hypothetical protein
MLFDSRIIEIDEFAGCAESYRMVPFDCVNLPFTLLNAKPIENSTMECPASTEYSWRFGTGDAAAARAA